MPRRAALRATLLSSLLSVLLFTPPLHAGAVPTPTILDGGRIIDVVEAKRLLESGEPHFIDTRSALNYGRGHVPGAQLAPYGAKSEKRADFNAALDQFPLNQLPKPQDAALVFYSHGDTGWKSYKAAVLAIRAGYSRVMWMRPGFAAWSAAGLPSE